jgi:hypothetical protein
MCIRMVLWASGACKCDIREITSPSFKNLILEGCGCTRFAAITSPKLKSLVTDGGRITCDSSLVIVGPAVAHLAVSVFRSVQVAFIWTRCHHLPKHRLTYGNTVTLKRKSLGIECCKLVDGISNVISLEFKRFVAVVQFSLSLLMYLAHIFLVAVAFWCASGDRLGIHGVSKFKNLRALSQNE